MAATDSRQHTAFVTLDHYPQNSVIHRCPPEGEALTPCCGRTPFEIPRHHRITVHPQLVTCKKES